MKFLWPQRARLELLLTFLTGLIWGFCLSHLLRRERWQLVDPDGGLGRIVCGTTQARIMSTPTVHLTVQYDQRKKQQKAAALGTKLFNETRVLCMVLTNPQMHKNRALHVKRTWGTRCNKLLFMSTKVEKDLPIVALNVTEGYSQRWGKTRESFQYVYKNYFNEYDWFLKVDDDTFVVMENLRAFLYAYTPTVPVYFGSKFRSKNKIAYMSSGAGYVLSKMALKLFATRAYGNGRLCRNQSYGNPDVELGRCLKNVGVVAGDSRDERGIERFFPFSTLQGFQYHTIGLNISSKKTAQLKSCCSESAISFHQVPSFYVLEYIIYKLHAFGLPQPLEILPKKISVVDILKK
ncbi:glycoprotein-N-acetylgalactosamine 3-beta-galactosyltransferase 1-like [Scaptodrosophila lebanonensis]|uniref:Glycoprotein-N-acetylgalactosamine 3-beta-galactosyltransferase 1 n=1 Tax=Drosophila lebanonensis TaxID=7225 RepID=A0A6J2TNU9_DROLE|nr:glycoprotein-N-acetylgalactosamine 3-beta-galactosyltransferase 1-like [Scaptodrosophila lebanonensis]XP_030377724.1 glycoprotein-N-acetylgalactosamine 3-beta-galactosyltransferase 1-like [Scaptodrosophila lebanonensis]XP_030377725.1 glycoprotein-N-acetylgalactosamine 3-beta-galactosyltransferase 1-like [Scaptodrosophila lebanonensis]